MASKTITISDDYCYCSLYELKRLQVALDDIDIATLKARRTYEALRKNLEKIVQEHKE